MAASIWHHRFDLTARGFTLVGGRRDFIDGNPVAAIVYRRHVHVINLFVAQGMGPALPAPKVETVQGFNIRRSTDQALTLLAVSELNPDELEFGSKFEEASRAAHG
jgi:anti-sigma factor RsiW